MRDAARAREREQLAAQRAHVVRVRATDFSAGSRPRGEPRALRRDAGRAVAGVAALRLDAADRHHRLAPDVDHVAAEREREQRRVGEAELAGADEHDVLGDPRARERRVHAREAELERQRDVVGEDERRRAGAALAAVDRARSRARARGRAPSARPVASQNACSPTADLMPTGRPVASRDRLDERRAARRRLRTRVWPGGLTQSRPGSTPRIAAISGVTFAAGSSPPRPGFAPCESLISIARTGALGDRLLQVLEREAPVRVAAAEVAGADLEDQLAAVAVVRREPALAGVLQAAGERGALVERLTAGPDSAPKLIPETFTSDARPERVARPRAPPSTLPAGIA